MKRLQMQIEVIKKCYRLIVVGLSLVSNRNKNALDCQRSKPIAPTVDEDVKAGRYKY